MVVFALLGWATQTNGLIGLKIPPSLYHFDFIIWRTIMCMLFCLILGTKYIPPSSEGFWENLKDCWHSGVYSLDCV